MHWFPFSVFQTVRKTKENTVNPCKYPIIQVFNEELCFFYSVSNLPEPYAAPGGAQPGATCLRGPYLCGEVDPGSATLAVFQQQNTVNMAWL